MMNAGRAAALPQAVRRSIEAQALCDTNPCDSCVILGSFWPYSSTSFESSLVKSFKECNPVTAFQPHISELCEFYAELAARAAAGKRPDWVVRVLSSAEKEPEDSRPQALLAETVCRRTGARNVTDLFFKSEARPSMRMVKRLGGPDALKPRLEYVLQDLFVRPRELGGNALLLDDIYNVGASMRVYAYALKQFVGMRSVFGVNLAATRFRGGRDGHGMLKLDVSALSDRPPLSEVCIDADGLFHVDRSCSLVRPPARCAPRFMAERAGRACQVCLASPKRRRRWWRIWR